MTPEQQRIAIAEACGWTHCRYDWRGYDKTSIKAWIGISPINNAQGLTNPEIASWPLPDYINDLNAMHEAFRTLGRHWEICQVGDGYICRIELGPRNRDVLVGGLELLAVMSEAFLRTLGKWEDQP